MDVLSTVWGIFWYFFWIYAFIAYLMVLFSIIADIFRDESLNGWGKAVWMLFLVFVPFLTALVYLIARGADMSARQRLQARQAREESDNYVRSVAGTSSADEIAKAKTLLDSGSISASEFEALKAKALR